MANIVGGWDLPQVAAAQYALVTQELMNESEIGPYAAFRWAMDIIGLERGSLLDVGCGVGHYAVLCERFYPAIRYHGTDLSDAMLVYARGLAPLATFSVCEFHDNKFADYDIILTGQTIEQTDDPPEALDWLLTHARRYVILNRIRLTPDESHRFVESTYCGQMGRTWLWNRADIIHRIEAHAQIVAVNDWWATDQMTLVLKALE